MSDVAEVKHDFHADASAQRIARVYAEALLDEAQKQNAAVELRDEMNGVLGDISGADPLLRNFFFGGVVGREARKEALEKAFAGRASDLLVNFILVLNEHDRLELLAPILAAYGQLLTERSGEVRVKVASAVPLTDEFRQRLQQQMREMTKKEPVLELTVDPSLLGGLVVRVGDYLYDASVRARLAKIRNELIEKSSHAIQAGRDRFSSAV